MSVQPLTPQTTTDSDKRRRYERCLVKLDVTVESESNFYAGFSLNISEGGVFVATFDSQPMGTELQISIVLDDSSEPIHALGKVQWVREYNPQIPDMVPGMGLQFVSLSPADQHRIERFCAHLREPLFYDDDDF